MPKFHISVFQNKWFTPLCKLVNTLGLFLYCIFDFYTSLQLVMNFDYTGYWKSVVRDSKHFSLLTWGVKLGEKSVYCYLPNVFLWQSRREVRHVWYLRCMIFRNQCQRLWEWLVCGHIHGGNMLFLVSEHPIKINLCMAHCWYQFMLTHPYQWALSAGFLFGSLFPWTRDVVVLSLPLLLSVLSPVTPFPQVFFPVKAF